MLQSCTTLGVISGSLILLLILVLADINKIMEGA